MLKKLKHSILFNVLLFLLNNLFLMKKNQLPVKTCLVCSKPFSWRKKWERDWEHVKYCSERCRRNKNSLDE